MEGTTGETDVKNVLVAKRLAALEGEAETGVHVLEGEFDPDRGGGSRRQLLGRILEHLRGLGPTVVATLYLGNIRRQTLFALSSVRGDGAGVQVVSECPHGRSGSAKRRGEE